MRTARSSDFAWRRPLRMPPAARSARGPCSRRARPASTPSASHVLTEVLRASALCGIVIPLVQQVADELAPARRRDLPRVVASGSDGAVTSAFGSTKSRTSAAAPRTTIARDARVAGRPSRRRVPWPRRRRSHPQRPGPTGRDAPSTLTQHAGGHGAHFSTCCAPCASKESTTTCTGRRGAAAGRRVERQPAVAREPDLDPGVRVVVGRPSSCFVRRVVGAAREPDRDPRRDPELAAASAPSRPRSAGSSRRFVCGDEVDERRRPGIGAAAARRR